MPPGVRGESTSPALSCPPASARTNGRRRPAPSIVDPGESRKGPRPWRWLGAYVATGIPRLLGDLAYMPPLADEDEYPALPRMYLPEQLQQGARLDLPMGRRHPIPSGDVGQRNGDGDLAAAVGLLVVLPSLVDGDADQRGRGDG